MLNFTRIRSIHHLLTQEASASLLLSLCISHLDDCNSIFYGLPDSTIEKATTYSKHVCMLSIKKNQMGECNRHAWHPYIGYQLNSG